MVDDDGVVPDRCGKVLFVIDIQSGDIIQRVPLYQIIGRVSAILVDGDKVYIADWGTDFSASKVVVFELAGSEA